MSFRKNEMVFVDIMGNFEEVKVKKIYKKKLVVEDRYTNELHILKTNIIRNKSLRIHSQEFFSNFFQTNNKEEMISNFVPSLFNSLFYMILLVVFFTAISLSNLIFSVVITLLFFIAGVIYFMTEYSYEVENKAVEFLAKKWN